VTGGILLDTCAVIWSAVVDALNAEAESALQAAYDSGEPIWISPFSAWEVGMLVSKGRLALTLPPERWFQTVISKPGVRLAPVEPDMLIRSSHLPGTPSSDPADSIIIATARELGATVMTRDRRILDYGTQGHVAVMAC